MPDITIDRPTFERLSHRAGQPASRVEQRGERRIGPYALPDLTHSKVLAAMAAVDIRFMWRGGKEAAFPGKSARLQIAGMEDER